MAVRKAKKAGPKKVRLAASVSDEGNVRLSLNDLHHAVVAAARELADERLAAGESGPKTVRLAFELTLNL